MIYFHVVDDNIGCSLEDVLMFCSGTDCVPVLGFDRQPTITFLHHPEKGKLPTASACDIQLRLPAVYKEYSGFRDAMILGLLGNDGFGGV